MHWNGVARLGARTVWFRADSDAHADSDTDADADAHADSHAHTYVDSNDGCRADLDCSAGVPREDYTASDFDADEACYSDSDRIELHASKPSRPLRYLIGGHSIALLMPIRAEAPTMQSVYEGMTALDGKPGKPRAA